MDSNQANAQAQHLAMMLFPMIMLFSIIFMVILIIPLWKIATKAGLSGPLSLLALIPGVGLLVALYVIAFMDWKVVPTSAVAPAYPPTYPPQNPPTPPSPFTSPNA